VTYLVGYKGQTKTLAQLEAWRPWKVLDGEFRRRILRMCDDHPSGGLGIGGGGRTTAEQRTLFLSRHHVDPNGPFFFEGQRWAKDEGESSAAPPGLSFHEAIPPDGSAVAVDMIGDLEWMMPRCRLYGLRHFADVNNEPWHVQPIEIPKARRDYDPAKHWPLPRFLLPGDVKPPDPPKPPPTEDVEMILHIVCIDQERPELAQVDGELFGFASLGDREALIEVAKAQGVKVLAWPVTAAQFDEIAARSA
jgi:hypothetical protein